MSITIRPGRDDDAEGFIRLIGDAWAEYPNCVLDVDAEVPELRALATHFEKVGGALWAAEDESDDLVGMVATRPLRDDDEAWEIGRMYVAKAGRGTGLAHRLLDGAERHAVEHGARRMILWTDTRFEAAHRFYEKRGYVRAGSIRILDDISKSLEFRYAKPATGVVVEALDAAAAASAERRLAEIMAACVAAGASVNYLPPLSAEVARAFWRTVSADVATGGKVLLAAWCDGQIAGTVHLALAQQPNAPHRAEVSKLLVDPAFRRRGIGRALMLRAEQTARSIGRRLLVLDTEAGSDGERLYRDLGWQEVGTIPGYSKAGDGHLIDTVVFWKTP
ncbi:GNAT family N-acetyltransferase [Roseomonas populi]|uniref:GNAT family N-acetyltransferase n=1 Tax=Roseomonas populi TaxID=3121582 RepID=A0ABT1X0Y7_9PROT|nr:GNAT family N-acetyltransferase [Roseomonas pecuniae]MCR0981762.1 GNAT family N-acetyltransferase [Roseomonas pecuniae]